ncbi:ATP-dependent DNA helicase PIF1-like [Megachile rotundata]|uniref:ATP-dependent DNA helicase PIF1-like n=1 Tax=Megachile rotundata TaxID=143995 RepID=UPI003FD09556
MDEYSMARPALLAMINDRLQSAKGNRLLFGGVFVYLVGDIFQLPPVLAPAFFSKMNGNTNSLDVRGREIFRSEFKKVFILTSNHRQVGSSQSAFRNMLTNLSRGEDLESIVNFLNQRVRKGTDNTENHTIISHTKELVKQTNYTKLEQTRMTVALIEAKNVPRDAEAADCGFPNTLQISVGSKVILIYNLSVRHGLANGSQGIVKDIIYKPGTKSPDDIPCMVLVQFQNLTGLSTNIIPITPVTRNFLHNGKQATRLQIPLILAWAFTTHKSQGLTLLNTLVNISNEFSPGLAYVALSRVSSIEGLLIENTVTLQLLEQIKKKGERKLNEFKRLERLSRN